jgi:hypothetical protein
MNTLNVGNSSRIESSLVLPRPTYVVKEYFVSSKAILGNGITSIMAETTTTTPRSKKKEGEESSEDDITTGSSSWCAGAAGVVVVVGGDVVVVPAVTSC